MSLARRRRCLATVKAMELGTHWPVARGCRKAEGPVLTNESRPVEDSVPE